MTRTGGDGFAAALSADERAALFAAGRRRRYARHARVFHEGERSDFVIVIVEGRVKIVATAEDGSEAVRLLTSRRCAHSRAETRLAKFIWLCVT